MNPASIFSAFRSKEKTAKPTATATPASATAPGASRKSSIIANTASSSSASPASSSSLIQAYTNSASSSSYTDLSPELRPFSSYLNDIAESSASHREEQFYAFFLQLLSVTPPTQIQALDLLSTLIQNKPSVLLGCSNVFGLLIMCLQSSTTSTIRSDSDLNDASTTLYCKLFYLLSSISQEHLNVRELKRLIRILRRVIERKSPPLLCRLMLSSLSDMATHSSRTAMMYVSPTTSASSASSSQPLPSAPSCCFDFSGTQSALALPPIEKWNATKGYTVSIWIRWEAQPITAAATSPTAASSSSSSSSTVASSRLPIAQPINNRGSISGVSLPGPIAHLQPPPTISYLYSFLTDKCRGIEALVGKEHGKVIVRSCSKGVLQEVNTEVKLPEKKWCLLTICHKKPQTFSRSSGTLQVFLNEDLAFEGELSYPQLTEPLIFNAFGAATHPSKPSTPFRGRMSTISFHLRPLLPPQIAVLYRRGADFCINVLNQINQSGKFFNFVSNSLSSLFGAISTVATTVQGSAASSEADEADASSSASASSSELKKQTEMYRDIYKNLLCLYHPKCVEKHVVLDCAPHTPSSNAEDRPFHGSILPGVQLCMYQDIRDLLYRSIGGMNCFYPIFQHLDVISPVRRKIVRSDSAAETPRTRAPSSILPLLFRTLQLMLRENLANQVTFLEESGFQIIAHLLTKYTSVYHMSESVLAPIEEMLREFSWTCSLQRMKMMQMNAEMSNISDATGVNNGQTYDHTNHAIPVARAAEKTLYNDLFLHILLNMALWFRTESNSSSSSKSSSSSSSSSSSISSSSVSTADLQHDSVPYVVQYEVLMMIKNVICKNPRYFRRLLSAGGGSGNHAAVPQSLAATSVQDMTHAAGASVGPVKFVLDSLRRFLNYQTLFDQYATISATIAASSSTSSSLNNGLMLHPHVSEELCQSLRQLRTLRREWLHILQSLMLCSMSSVSESAAADGTTTEKVIRETDITTFLQLLCEASESSAASSSGNESPYSTSPAPSTSSAATTNSTSAHSWILAEYVEFLTSLMHQRADEMYPILQRNGGCMLFISMLGRNSRYQHVQVAIIHLLTSLLMYSFQNERTAESATQIAHVISALQVTLSDSYLSVSTYEALLELACGLAGGSFTKTASDAAEEAIEQFCTATIAASSNTEANQAAQPDTTTSATPSSPSSASIPSSSSSSSYRLLSRSSIRFPRALEAIHMLIRNNNVLRERERVKMRESWKAEVQRRRKADEMRDQESKSRMPPPLPPAAHRGSVSDNIHFDAAGSPSAPIATPLAPTAVPLPFTFYHASFNPLLGPQFAVLVSPCVLISRFLFDLDCLTMNSTNCGLLLLKWSGVGMQLCMKEMDWTAPESTNATRRSTRPSSPLQVRTPIRKTESKEDIESESEMKLQIASPRSKTSDVSAPQSEPLSPTSPQIASSTGVRPIQLHLEFDSLLNTPQPQQSTSIEDAIINKSPLVPVPRAALDAIALTADVYYHAVSKQQLLADIDMNTPADVVMLTKRLAAKIIEALLFHGIAHVKDGWMHLRDALILLRLEGEQQQQQQDQSSLVTEECFRSIRRRMLVGLFGRLEELPRPPNSSSVAALANSSASASSFNPILLNNLAHLIDLLEELLYFDSTQRFKQLKFRMVDSEGNETTHDGGARKLSRIESVTRQTSGGASEWVLMDEDDDMPSSSGASSSASASLKGTSTPGGSQQQHDPFASASGAVVHPLVFRQEWNLINHLLQCLVHLRFSLQPSRYILTGNSVVSSALHLVDAGLHSVGAQSHLAGSDSGSAQLQPTNDSASASPGPPTTSAGSVPLRTGGPLRVVIRLLLDCCSAVCLSTEHHGSAQERSNAAALASPTGDESAGASSSSSSSVAQPCSVLTESNLMQLQDMVSSLGALVHVELAIGTITTASGQRVTEQSMNREWKNRYVLHILWRLCQIMHILPQKARVKPSADPSQQPPPASTSDQMRSILHNTVNQIVESLKPFAVVPFSQFDHAPPTATTYPGQRADLPVYVPLVVNEDGFLDVEPSFPLPLRKDPTDSAPPSSPPSPSLDEMLVVTSAIYPRIMRSCNEYIAASVQLFHSLELQYASDYSVESEKLERNTRRRLKDFHTGDSYLKESRAAWKSVQTYSYTEANRRAVTDNMYSEHLVRVSEMWRTIAHDLYAEGSAWSSESSTSRRKFYQIDTVEDGYRMRRKIKVDHEAVDHHQATQAYIDHARTVAMRLEKEKKNNTLKKSITAAAPSSPASRLALPAPTTQPSSTSSPVLAPATTPAPVSSPSASPIDLEASSDPLPSPTAPSASPVAATAPSSHPNTELDDADAEQQSMAALNALGKSLGSALKSAERLDNDELFEAEEKEPNEEEKKTGVESLSEVPPTPTSSSSSTSISRKQSVASNETQNAAEDGLTSKPKIDRPVSAVKSDGTGDDWDLIGDEVPTTMSSTPSLAPTFNPASLYTSPMCTLVLPIGTIYGTLEISPGQLKFSFNPNAEATLLQQQMILTEQLVRSQNAEAGTQARVYAPPPKPKPFTLPSLDAVRAHERKDRVWPLDTIVAVYRRRYQLQKTALEFFMQDGHNYFIDFSTRNERKLVLRKILNLRPPKLIRLCSRSVSELLSRSRITEKWINREMSNFQYLMHLNTVSGRTYNDINQYFIFPWILRYYPEARVKLVNNPAASSSSSSSVPAKIPVEVRDENEIDIQEVIRAGPSHPKTPVIFRDLSLPMGALDPTRLEQILERFNTFYDTTIPPFHYGSHYSNAATTLFYLMRLEPYASLHIELQAGKFDWSDRLFSSLAQTWKNCCTSLSCYKELVPEFFYNESFLDNINQYDLGMKQDGQVVGDVTLPTWANDSSAEFIRIHRLALESEYVSQNLHAWIDLIWGYKQKGPAARDAHNLFFHLTYEGAVDLATIKDPIILEAITMQVAQFGQTPIQLFKKPHPARQPMESMKMKVSLTLSSTLAQMLEKAEYHHPSLRRVCITKNQPLLQIKSYPNRFYTISAGFLMSLHVWMPDTTSEIEEPATPGRSVRRYALPFTYALAATQTYSKLNPITPGSILFTSQNDGRLMIEGNNWDDSLRVYQLTSSVNIEAMRKENWRATGAISSNRDNANPYPGQGSATAIPNQFGDMKLTLSQSLIQHRDRITQIALGRDDKTLVTGSRDCTLLVWSLEIEEPMNRVSGIFQAGNLIVKPTPKHILRGHDEAIVAVAVDSEMDVCVSISARGLVLLHSLRKGKFLSTLTVPRVTDVTRAREEAHARTIANATAAALAAANGGVVVPQTNAIVSSPSLSSTSASSPSMIGASREKPNDFLLARSRTISSIDSPSTALHLPKLVAFGSDGCMVFYSVMFDTVSKRFMSPQLSCCTINARHWRAVQLEQYLMCMTLSADGKLIACGSEDGMLVLRRLHDLKIVQRFEPISSSITSIAFSYEQDYLYIGDSSGHLTIFAVKC